MPTPDDFELKRTPQMFGSVPPSSPRNGPPILPIAIIGGAIVALLGGGAWWMSRAPATPTNATSKVVASTEAPIAAAAAAPAVALPALDEMEPLMRKLLGALSARPELARWLATDNLIRQLAAAIDVGSQGKSPARDFKSVAPAKPFLPAGRGRTRTMNPASYQRYDGLVITVTSIDASAVARVYKTIQPRLNEAYRQRGHPDGDVNSAANDALTILVETPVVEGPIRLVEGTGARWAYADRKLESLSPSQKQLLRMGPENVEKVLVWLRALQQQLNP